MKNFEDPSIHYCVALARGRVVGFAGWAKSNIDYDLG